MKSRDSILVVDFGTSNVRASLVAVRDGKIVKNAAARYRWLHPGPDFTEIDPEDIWRCSCRAVRDLLKDAGKRTDIRGLSFSFFGDNVIPADRKGRPLYNLLPAFDPRAQREAGQWMEKVDFMAFWEITGGPIAAMNVGSKILWLKNNEPGVFEKAEYFDDIQQFILRKLGLPVCSDYTMASRKMFYDIRGWRWSERLLDVPGIKAESLGAEITGSATVIGKVKKYGPVSLCGEVPVVLGAHDVVCGFTGLGAVSHTSGFLAEIVGTMDIMGCLTDRAVSSVACYCGPERGSYTAMLGVLTAGAVLEWYVNTLHPKGRSGKDIFGKLFANILFDGTGTLLTVPQFDAGRGAVFGLSLGTDLAAVFRSIVESAAFESKGLIDIFDTAFEKPFGTLHIGGGGSQSPNLLQLRADVSGKRVGRARNKDVSTLGAAVIAAVALGFHPDLAAALRSVKYIDSFFEPQVQIAKRYANGYTRYNALKVSLMGVS